MSLQSGGHDAEVDSWAILLSADCRALRRALRPLVWVTLEEVALDAVAEEGRLVARTSARRVAEHLGVDPGTASAALKVLRERGLVRSSREKGPAGRFGLSVYELGPVAGLSVIQPLAAEPCVAPPPAAEPGMAVPCMDGPLTRPAKLELPRADGPDGLEPGTVGRDILASPEDTDPDSSDVTCRPDSHGRRARRPASGAPPAPCVQCPGQTSLDLGWGSS